MIIWQSPYLVYQAHTYTAGTAAALTSAVFQRHEYMHAAVYQNEARTASVVVPPSTVRNLTLMFAG